MLVLTILINWYSFLQCSVTCEKGVKQRVVQCKDINNNTVNESFCRSPKPSITKFCFAGSCKSEWFTSHKWSHVSRFTRLKHTNEAVMNDMNSVAGWKRSK